MKLLIEVLGYGVLVPAAISVALVFVCRRFLPGSVAVRYSAALALGVATFVGYVLLPEWAPLRPTSHWQWLVYLGLGAVVMGPMGLAKGVFTMERWALYLLAALLAAWLLVPTWSDLQPSRAVFITMLTGYLFLLSAMLDRLAIRVSDRLFLSILAMVGICTSVMLAVSISVKFGHVALITAAAMIGCWTASFFDRHRAVARGVALPYTVLVGGVAFAGYVAPKPPLTGLLLIPLAPLALWLFVRGPLARLQGAAATAVPIATVVAVLGAASAWVLLAQ